MFTYIYVYFPLQADGYTNDTRHNILYYFTHCAKGGDDYDDSEMLELVAIKQFLLFNNAYKERGWGKNATQ